MKKIITTALALVLSLGMSVTAFAAASPSAGVTGGTTTLADGTTYDAEITALDSETTAVAQEKAKELIGSDSQVLKAVEVTLPATVSASNPATVEFVLTDVTDGTALVALHQKADGTWETLDCVWKDGKVYVTFTSLSPVVFATAATTTDSSDDSSDSSDDSSDSSSSSTTDSSSSSTTSTASGVTSPKTADAGMNALAFTTLFLGAVLVCVNRKRA